LDFFLVQQPLIFLLQTAKKKSGNSFVTISENHAAQGVPRPDFGRVDDVGVTLGYGGGFVTDKGSCRHNDLILLDINLPYQDGFQVCREIRQKSNLPIIVLTSRNSDFDELMSLNIGADDYIAKPYNAQILLARIQKLLARTYEVQDNIVLTHKGLTLNLLKAEISYQGNKKALTKNELGILRLLMVNKGNIIPRDAIIDELWQSEQFIDENTLNVNVSVCCCCIAEPPGNHGWRGDFTACRR
jgi:DNA-binding response OmpR family regulator